MGPSQQLDNGMANNIMLQCLSFVTVTFSASVTASLYHRGTVSQMSYDNYAFIFCRTACIIDIHTSDGSQSTLTLISLIRAETVSWFWLLTCQNIIRQITSAENEGLNNDGQENDGLEYNR